MATINTTSNIVLLKKSQYDKLKSGEQIDGYSFSDSDVYIPDFNSLYKDIKNATVSNSYNLGGHPADYFATKEDLNSYQPYNSMLTAITKASGTYGVLRKTDFGTWTLDRTLHAELGGYQTFTGKNIFTSTNSYQAIDAQKFLVGNNSSTICIGGDGLQCFSGINSNTSKNMYINFYGGNVIIGRDGGDQTINLQGTVQENGVSLSSKYAAASHNHNNSYLSLSGGTMTGGISYKGTKATYSMIRWIDNTADDYGNGIRIGGGGATIIGGGESADLPSVSGGDEILYLMNDGNIDFYSNCQGGLNSAKHMSFDTSGNLTVPTDVKVNGNSVIHTGNIGSQSVDYATSAGSANSVAWGNVSNKPFSGTNFISGNINDGEHNANSAITNGHYYYNSNGPATSLGASYIDGALYVQSYSDSWVGQIAQDYRNGSLFVRGKNNGTWTSWKRIIDSSNIGSNGQFLSVANGVPNWVNNPNTDTKVTAVGNHYSPSGGTSLTASSSGTASRGSTNVLTNIKIDAAGHITGGTWYTLPSSDNTNTATAADNILDGSNSGTQITYAPYTSQQSKLSFDTSASAPTRTDRLNLNGYLYATKFNVAGKVAMQYNSTEDCIEFIFT